ESERRRFRRDLSFSDQPAVESAAFPQSKHGRRYTRRVVGIGPERCRTKGEKEPGQHRGVLDDFAFPLPEYFGNAHVGERRTLWSGLDWAEMALDHCQCFLGIEIAGDGQKGVVGSVVRREELPDLIEARRAE